MAFQISTYPSDMWRIENEMPNEQDLLAVLV